MAFRSKSPRRVVQELGALTSRYRVLRVEAVDNIMDMRYLTSVCTALRDSHWDLKLFFEVKANVSRAQLRALKEAGVTCIQPGLESLSNHVLSLMRKGTTMLTTSGCSGGAFITVSTSCGTSSVASLASETKTMRSRSRLSLPSVTYPRQQAG